MASEASWIAAANAAVVAGGGMAQDSLLAALNALVDVITGAEGITVRDVSGITNQPHTKLVQFPDDVLDVLIGGGVNVALDSKYYNVGGGEIFGDAAVDGALTVGGQAIGRYGCRVHKAAAQTISNNLAQALTFDTEDRDDGGFHEGVTHPTRLTAPVDGWYLVWAGVLFASNTTGYRMLQVIQDGGAPIARNALTTPIAGVGYVTVSTVVYLAATSYVEIYAYQNSGGDLTVTANEAYSPYAAMALL